MNKGIACPYNSLNRIEVNQDPNIQSRENRLETSNKKKKRRILIVETSVLVLILIFRILLFLYYAQPNNITLSLMIGFIILFVFITIAITDGLRSINKFRKGYNINISGKVERDDGERTKNTNDE